MTRTHDLLITNQLLYRLSYTSKETDLPGKIGKGKKGEKTSSLSQHDRVYHVFSFPSIPVFSNSKKFYTDSIIKSKKYKISEFYS